MIFSLRVIQLTFLSGFLGGLYDGFGSMIMLTAEGTPNRTILFRLYFTKDRGGCWQAVILQMRVYALYGARTRILVAFSLLTFGLIVFNGVQISGLARK